MNISKELKVGILSAAALVMLYLGFNFLKGSDFFSSDATYYVVYQDIDGLTVSNQVLINGYAVGRVNKVTLLPSTKNHLLVELHIRKDIPIGKGTKAILADGGLLGGKMIELELISREPFLENNDTLLSETKEGLPSMMAKKAQPLIESVDSTLYLVNKLLKELEGIGTDSKLMVQNINGTVGNFNGVLTENRQNLKQLSQNLNELSLSLKQTSKGIEPLVGKFNNLADSLNAVEFKALNDKTQNLLAELEKTTKAINKAEGSMGLLIHNDSLYRNLNATMEDLDSLFIDLKQNPKRYVHFSLFGRKDKSDKNKK
ncbi:MlaD family protein [Hugenholtzia roseola]|uniref:MlaD family protein n=1 Tax=Hugenholtzia roseola TaxID=1002 RepID=UPI00047AC215|nr:MlaD family protein [Hugenholtzia roseola]